MSDSDSGSFIDDDSLNDFSGGEGQVRGLCVKTIIRMVWDESEEGLG